VILLDRLRRPSPFIGVELRPPRSDLSYADSVDTWIDMYHSVSRLARHDTVVFLTDNAVGESEEENLQHLSTNLAGEVDPSKVVPFLTCKHTLDYCTMYARRAASHGIRALTVLGGDRTVGPPRCVPHASDLRQVIRGRIPSLTLGGWANPHRDACVQVDYLLDQGFTAEFYITQVVSHHSIRHVERFMNEAARRNVHMPGMFGVFLYRSANPRTLDRLGAFFPVPAAELTREFDAGLSAETICARSIRALQDVGADKVYLSNLGVRGVDQRYAQIRTALETC
jgi:5,10-methylenetetrahydrofolate reductase